MIEWSNTERGFRLGKFRDSYHERCSIQSSSNAEVEALWLGVDDPQIVRVDGMPVALARMHLTREQAGQLAEVLQRFAETGELP